MTLEAFELSERFHIPVMLRLCTRVAHSRAVVATGERRPQRHLDKSRQQAGWMLLPATARVLWADLLRRHEQFVAYAEGSPHNAFEPNEAFREFGVLTAGLGWNYYVENREELPVRPPHLHVSLYPLPVDKIRRLAAAV